MYWAIEITVRLLGHIQHQFWYKHAYTNPECGPYTPNWEVAHQFIETQMHQAYGNAAEIIYECVKLVNI